jgi:hypothetical protein
LTDCVNQQSQKPNYDLNKIHTEAISAKDLFEPEKFHNIMTKLVNPQVFGSHNRREYCKQRLGYSTKYNSLTISLLDGDKVKTVVIRKADDIKWKTYGTKTFVPHRIEDEFIFLYSGMAEIILMEALGLSYIGLQSDSVLHRLPIELKELCQDKVIVVLSDNDDSFKRMIPKLKNFFEYSDVVIIDFEILLDRKLQQGYDFRDFCNEIKYSKDILKLLENEIVRRIEDV